MKAIFDTSPICYLVLIGQADILPRIFSEILIPEAVARELRDPRSPQQLLEWMEGSPSWLTVRRVSPGIAPKFPQLHAGEREVIALARELDAWVVLDEKAARQVATEQGLQVTGLLGILDRAAAQGLLRLREAVEELRHTGFHVHPSLLKTLLAKHRGPH